jgi:putative ABC transport system permease protein
LPFLTNSIKVVTINPHGYLCTMLLNLLKESVIYALQAMLGNKLRTILSLTGITIGIFAIISVFTMVDWLEHSVRKSVASLGNDVVFVQKWPWLFGNNYPWWKYMNRPVPDMDEMKEIQKRSTASEASCFVADINKTIKFRSNSVENVNITGVSQDYNRVKSLNIEHGRYFTDAESNGGRGLAVIGSTVAETLFGNAQPVGKQFKLMGQKVTVIGVFKKEGESIIGGSSDNSAIMPINYIRNVIDIDNDRVDPCIMVKAKEGVPNDALIGELNGIMRSIRKLPPAAAEDFALNETSLISNSLDGLFSVIKFAGGIIGLFSILVGGFGIANIMFVSVKERTNTIGIQKALGAKNYFILLEFLIESIVLCLSGGMIGLFLIFLATLAARSAMEIDIILTPANIILGLGISASIGIISGFIPAYLASRLDPVVAIRG